MTVSIPAPAAASVAAPRVGMIAYALDRATGGIARYTRELRSALVRAGLPLTTLQAGGARPPSANTVRMPGAGLLPGLMTLGQVEIAWTARARGLALVHDPTGVSPLMLTSSQRVATIHDVIPLLQPAASTTLDRLIYQRWLPMVARRLDAIITVSECSKRDIVRLLGVNAARVHVVPNAVSEAFRPADRHHIAAATQKHGISGPYILYVGSVEARKNLPRLLHAYAALRKMDGSRQLVIVGVPGWKSSPVFATVERLGLQASVRFTGFVSDEDLPALYSGADLFVFPSLYEGCGLPVLEAMACGTPVVTSSTSSLPEVAGDAAVYCDPTDEPALTAAMQTVLNDANLGNSLVERGIERARTFGWDRSALETMTVYQHVLSGASAPPSRS